METTPSTRPSLLRFAAALLAVAAVIPVAAADDETASAETPRTVLVTGANRGLGLEFAQQYAADGWRVIGTAREPEEAAELKATGARVVALDVADADSVARMAAELDGAPIDLLINNAGIMNRADDPGDLDLDRIALVLDVNTLGPMRVTAALLPNLRAGRGKTVAAITSGLGSIASNTSGGFYGYRESKAALNMYTRSLAADLDDEGFTCIVMSPGWVQTDMGGPNATLTPEQSIAGMRKVIAGLTPADSGGFFNWDGERLPW